MAPVSQNSGTMSVVLCENKNNMILTYKFESKILVEDRRTTSKNVKEIQQWLTTTCVPNLQIETIALFLIACDNDISATQTTIKNFFRIKSEAPEIFSNRDIDSVILTKTRQVL